MDKHPQSMCSPMSDNNFRSRWKHRGVLAPPYISQIHRRSGWFYGFLSWMTPILTLVLWKQFSISGTPFVVLKMILHGADLNISTLRTFLTMTLQKSHSLGLTTGNSLTEEASRGFLLPIFSEKALTLSEFSIFYEIWRSTIAWIDT